MTCKTTHNKIIFYLEGELPEAEMQQLSRHLETCRECSLFAEDLQKTLAVVSEEKAIESDPYFYTRLKARMENRAEQNHGIPFILARIVQPLAFSIILAMGIYGGIKLGQPQKNTYTSAGVNEQQMVPYFNEMADEPIESFLME